MIQLAMIFALGFLCASLLFLLLLPVVSRRAVRLATRRLQMLVPLSMSEIVAERDQIRAEHAAASRRLEQKYEALTHNKADLMSLSGRQATQVLALEQERAKAQARIEDLLAELDRTAREAFEAQATLGTEMKVLYDTVGLAERRLDTLRATEAQLSVTEVQAEERRATIAALETRNTGQDLRIRIALTQVAKAAEDLSRARATIEGLNTERDVMRAEAAALLEKHDALQAELEAERERGLAGEKRYADQAEHLAGLAARVAEQAGDIAGLQRFLTAANSKRDAVQAERDRLVQAAERTTKELADKHRTLQAMEASRLDDGFVKATPTIAAWPEPDPSLNVLREAISSIASELLRLHEDRAIPAPKAAGQGRPDEQATLPLDMPPRARTASGAAPAAR